MNTRGSQMSFTFVLEYKQSKTLSYCNRINIWVSTLYTSVPLSITKNKLIKLVLFCFMKKMANVDTSTCLRKAYITICK